MEYIAEDLIGQPHSTLCSDDYADSEEYAAFWRDVCNGRFFSGRFPRAPAAAAPSGGKPPTRPCSTSKGKPSG
jgi:hypothetical protein